MDGHQNSPQTTKVINVRGYGLSGDVYKNVIPLSFLS